MTLLTLFLIAEAGFWGYRYYIDHHTKATAANRSAQAILTDPYVGWKTYKSDAEQATFRYPTNWTVTSPSSSGGLVDSTAIKSPSGAITVTWISTIASGFGNEHSASYPAHTVIDKTPITGAPGLYVVSGITTLDGATYYPWIAVQDSSGILTSQVNGDLLLLTGRHNYDPSLARHPYMLFSTSGIRAHENSPALTQAQAIAWFSGAEAKQAKLILLSFSDPQNQYLTIKEWGVKIPLSSAISDLYYAWAGSSNDPDGLESTLSLGLTSLDSSCGQVAYGNQGWENTLAFIVRTLPTDRDPVSGKLYSELDPHGVTINGYYYGLADRGLQGKSCAPPATLQAVDTALATAMSHMVPDGSSWQVYKSTAGGFQFPHPADWSVTEGTDRSMDTITVKPADTQANTANPFAMQLWIGTNQDGAFQPSSLPDGVIQYPPHGFLHLWVPNEQTSIRTSSNTTYYCPQIQLLSLNPTHFSLTLPNGKYLTMSAGYCLGSGWQPKLTYDQQLASENWLTAENMAQWIEWIP